VAERFFVAVTIMAKVGYENDNSLFGLRRIALFSPQEDPKLLVQLQQQIQQQQQQDQAAAAAADPGAIPVPAPSAPIPLVGTLLDRVVNIVPKQSWKQQTHSRIQRSQAIYPKKTRTDLQMLKMERSKPRQAQMASTPLPIPRPTTRSRSMALLAAWALLGPMQFHLTS
jgi:hypothetical protein